MMYSYKEIIGSGSYGTVYKAVHIPTNKLVAIKKLPIKRDDIPFNRNQAMIEREMNNWTKLTGHKNITELLDLFIDEDTVHFVSELGLNNLVDKNNISKVEIKNIIKDISYGINYCHKNNIVHCDIKPGNIIEFSNSNYKLCDFGNSQICKDNFEGLLDRRGTPAYAAPEIFKNCGYGFNVDVWSIGILTYRLFYNHLPYESLTPKILIDSIVNKDITLNYEIYEPIIDFMKHCLVRDKKKRISMNELLKHEFLQ